MSIPKGLLKQDLSGLIVDWGVTCKVKRFSGAFDGAGRTSGAFVSAGTETFWIQPFDVRRRNALTRELQGIADDDIFEVFWRFSGFALQVEDRISSPTTILAYDVVSEDQPENYRHAWVKLTKRS